MAEELQSLLDRIQKEGLDRADAEVESLIAEAKEKAKTIVSEAEKKAADMIEKAKSESELFLRRSESALSQSARDLILSVGEAISETLQAIVNRRVDDALQSDAFPEFVREAIKVYAESGQASGLEVLLSEQQKKAVTDYFFKECAAAMQEGLTIRSQRNMVTGFRVAVKETGVEHDFTGESLAAAMGELLRPQLAAFVDKAVKDMNQETNA